ncbi:uncharacterized protein [Periplaneta americana]|uniref:uncharacterized protein n=2 Tax=Periplaneta americana TaxID=6978 RepID=UPI0037E81C80
MSKLEWTEDAVINLINVYREQEALWNPKHPFYHNKLRKHDAWEAIGKMFSCKAEEVKKKIESLLTSFRRERQKSTKRSGMGSDEVYESTWFAYKYMSFLLEKFTPRKTIDTFEVLGHENEDEGQNNNVPDETSRDFFDDLDSASTQVPCTTSEGLTSFSTPVCSTASPLTSGGLRKRKSKEDTRISEAYAILQATVAKQQAKDTSTIFGDFVATKHRSYSERTRCIVEHMIGNILFQADMGQFELSTQEQVSSNAHILPEYIDNPVETESGNVIYVIKSQE